MKRSEMIKMIADIICSTKAVDYFHPGLTEFEGSIEAVLSVAEEIGMLPPLDPKLGIDESVPTDEVLSCYHRWEPEDEI